MNLWYYCAARRTERIIQAMKPLLIALLLVAPLAARPRRVIIFRPSPRMEAVNLGGYVVASLIQQWIDRKQGRGPGTCDPFFDSGCHFAEPVLPAPRLEPVICIVGCSYLPGQTPGIGDGK